MEIKEMNYYLVRNSSTGEPRSIFCVKSGELYRLFDKGKRIDPDSLDLEKITKTDYETYEAIGCVKELSIKRPLFLFRSIANSKLFQNRDIVISAIIAIFISCIFLPLFLLLSVIFGTGSISEIALYFLNFVLFLMLWSVVVFGIFSIIKEYVVSTYDEAE